MDHLLEVCLKFGKAQSSITIEVNAVEDLLNLNKTHLDSHQLEGFEQFFFINLSTAIRIYSGKQIVNRLVLLSEYFIDLHEDLLLELNNFGFDNRPIFFGFFGLQLVLHLDLVLSKNAEESLVVDASRLVAPEVFDELIEFTLIELELSQVVENLSKVLFADIAFLSPVNHFKEF